MVYYWHNTSWLGVVTSQTAPTVSALSIAHYSTDTPSLLQGANNCACRTGTPTRTLRPIRQACKTWCKAQKTPTPRVGDRVALVLEQHRTTLVAPTPYRTTGRIEPSQSIVLCTETVSVQEHCSIKKTRAACALRGSLGTPARLPICRKRSGTSIIPSFFLWPEVEHDTVVRAME